MAFNKIICDLPTLIYIKCGKNERTKSLSNRCRNLITDIDGRRTEVFFLFFVICFGFGRRSDVLF